MYVVAIPICIQIDPPQGIVDLAGATVIRSSKKEHGFDITVSLLYAFAVCLQPGNWPLHTVIF